MKKSLILLLSVLSLSVIAVAADNMITRDIELADGRSILADDITGLTLYTFDVDAPGVSNCFDSCLATWPALTTELDALASPFGVHVRPDGVKQVTLNDSPLYFFIGDQMEGDITGDGLGSVWHIITTGK